MSNGGPHPQADRGGPGCVAHTRALRSRRGRVGLLALLLTAALAGGALISALTGGPEASEPDAATPKAEPAGPSAGPSAGPGSAEAQGVAAVGRIEVGMPLPYKDLPRSFKGRGHLSGVVEVVGGGPFPERWTLVLEPSKFGTGREHATRRVRELEGNVRTFEEFDLPLGGYTVSAQAEGLNSRPQEVLLFAIPNSPTGGKTRAHLILHLTPTGFLDGSVRDEAGVPVGDLPVFLENTSTKGVLESVTNNAGIWRFDGLHDGRYRLYYGSLERPLVPARNFTYNTPQRQLKEDEVPVTASVAFLALDEDGLAVMDARIRGFGRPGGQVVARSGPDGVAVVRFLPGGGYQVKADHKKDRLEGKADFKLEGDEVRYPVQVVLYPLDR
jgi:hypothetical protein